MKLSVFFDPRIPAVLSITYSVPLILLSFMKKYFLWARLSPYFLHIGAGIIPTDGVECLILYSLEIDRSDKAENGLASE